MSLACDEIGVVTTVRGPQYGSLAAKIVATVAPVAMLLGLASAFGSYSVSVPIACSVAMVIVSIAIYRYSNLEIESVAPIAHRPSPAARGVRP